MARFFTFFFFTLLAAASVGAAKPSTKKVPAKNNKTPAKNNAAGTKAPAKATGGTTTTTVVTSGMRYNVPLTSTCPSRSSPGFWAQAAAGNTAIVPCKAAADCTNFVVKTGFTACCMYPNCICAAAEISALAAGNGIGCLQV